MSPLFDGDLIQPFYTELNISPSNKHPPVHLMVGRAERVDAVADAHLRAYASPRLAPISANFAPRLYIIVR